MAGQIKRSALEFTQAEKQVITEGRQTLMDSIEDLEIIVAADPSFKVNLDQAKSALVRANAMYDIMVKHDPTMKQISNK